MVALLSTASGDKQWLLPKQHLLIALKIERDSFLCGIYCKYKWLVIFCWRNNAVSVADHYHYRYHSDHRWMVWMVTVSGGWVDKDLLVDCGLFQGHQLQFYCHTDLFSGTKWISKRVCVFVCTCMCVILVVFVKKLRHPNYIPCEE